MTQYYRYGEFSNKTIYDNNDYITDGDSVRIVLRDKKTNIVGYAVIDKDDEEKCRNYKWHLKKSRNTNYAIATINESKKIFLHRLILDYNGEDDTDHIDRNGLNNKKINLRVISHEDNLRNQSPNRKGIYQVKSGRYRATITKNYKSIYIGTYDTFEEAYKARISFEN